MLIRTQQDGFIHPLSSEITSSEVYANRRQLLRQWSAGAAAIGMGSWAQREAFAQGGGAAVKLAALPASQSAVQGAMTVEKVTSYKDATTYNNFYEFGTDKSDPARNAHTLKTAPWTIEVEGLVKKPTRFNLEDVMKWGAMQERIYRMRCVEGWSMVVPWIGYSLSDLIKRVEPLPSAKFVEFVTQADSQTMPGLRGGYIDWPYLEGLRMDEAMHPLSLLTFGMYGEVLPKQNGAPVRLVVPWKYGFKSGKSIVKIRFVEKQPLVSWAKAAPQEYGFYSNVNPTVDHPRWSQANERRIGEGGLLDKKRKTLMFNGYEAQVASLYAGMDLVKNFLMLREVLRKRVAKLALVLVSLMPFAWLCSAIFLDRLGPNPAEYLIRSTGDWTLRFLCITLLVTPLRVTFNIPEFLRFRRSLGLLTFFYVLLHALCYGLFDMGLEWGDIALDIVKRPFIAVGFAAAVMLSLLAATSSNAAIKKMGVVRWRLLHRLVYAIAVLAILHFFWMRAGKNNFTEVFVYAAILGVLLGWRVWHATTRRRQSGP